MRNIAEVTTAVANGDLSKKITVDVKGEILELKNTINTMVDQLSSFASEVTRVAREVGTEGKLGGQADVRGVSGTWKDLTDNVNFMAGNLTNQVRNIAKVVTAVAVGDLTQKLTVDAKGEIAELADTINGMIDTLETFADQVTTVAREVGVEGKLGGQASVPGAAGTWKHLTDNVNQLAANLTTQVRAIAEVATAVTKGDLTRSITVDARGELASLKDNINEMIRNLNDTTLKNSEQDWLKTNLAQFTRMLQGQRDLLTVARLILSELAPVVGAQHGVFYIVEQKRHERELRLLASYAFRDPTGASDVFKLGEGLVGQAAIERKKIVLEHVPPDYIRITSGLGEAPPVNTIVLPVLFEDEVMAVKPCSNCGATLIADPYGDREVLCPRCGKANQARGDVCDICGNTVGLKLKYDVDECQERGMTYAVPLKVTIRLVVWNKDPETGVKTIRDIKEQEVYFGDIPLMTENGTFIINGTERVIVSQLHRSPGAFFHSEDKTLYVAQIIPYRGSWVEFEYDTKNLLYVRIDRKRKFLASVFLRALGLRGADEIIRTFYTVDKLHLKNGTLYWAVADSLVGLRAAKDIVVPGENFTVQAGKKITKNAVEALKRANVEAVEIADAELEGAFAAADVVDPSTGEVILEANEALEPRVISMAQEKNVDRIEIFFPEKDEVGPIIGQTLKKDPIHTHEEALIEIYRRLRPGDPPTLDSSRSLFENMFFNPQKYDFSRVGRLKLNTKLGLNTPLDEKILHPQDFYEVIKYLLKLRKNPANVDDIDHLGNRRVRSVGELLENQFRIGLVRMERAIKEKMSVYQEMATAMPHDLINAKPVMAAIREFFGSSQLSQFMDQTNPLSEITHKRRLSALGPGGLSRERAGFEVRDVHPTHYGRICPIETPEGPNIGLISSLSCYARINEFGFIESPYRKVKDGRVIDYVIVTNAGGTKYKAGDIVEADELVSEDGRSKKKGVEFEPYSFYLSAWEEDQYIIAQANAAGRRRRQPDAGARQRAPGGQLHPGAARQRPVHRRLAEAARLGRRLAHPVPRERRREPRADGIEHAAPGGAAAPRAGAVCRHRHGVHHRARFGRGHRGAPLGHRRLRRQPAHRRARRERDRRRHQQGDGRRHLPDDEVQAVEPEHLHHPEADRPGRPEGAQGAGAGRRAVHGARRAGARPQRAGRVHAVARLQLRGRDPRLRADGEGRLLHVHPHRGVRDRGARHQARAGRNHARHPERVGRRSCKRPRRERHHPHRRLRQAGRHPGRQGHAEGRDAADAGREAAPRDLRREGRRRARRLAHLPAGHRGHHRRREDLLPQGHREGRPGQGDRAGRARHDGEEPAGRDPHPSRRSEEARDHDAEGPGAALGPLRRVRPRAAAQEGHRAHARKSCRRCPTRRWCG